MKGVVAGLVGFYQRFISPDQGVFSRSRRVCVFWPTCSEYTKEAIFRFGVWRGLWMGFLRIVRCHPFQKNTIDPLLP